MFPLRDRNPTELTPYFTIALIAVNVIVWVYFQGAGFSAATLMDTICRYGTIPAELTGRTGAYEGVELAPGATCEFGGFTWLTLLTSMFLHGSWLHLIGNMWFLWIFGNNIEDSMGHFRFLAFYLITGLAASGVHIASAAGSPVPTVGASGAISGVMGAYMILYPRIRIDTLFIIFFFIRIIPIPAWFVLAEWFVIQLFSGLAGPGLDAGVAFWAHIGGFVAGLALVKLFENPRLVAAKKRHVKLRPEDVRHRGWWG